MPKRIAVFGSQDTYAAEIARLLFPDGTFIYTSPPGNQCLEVMTKVRKGDADLGIVPFWNTHAENEGVPLSYEDLAKSKLFVCDIPWLHVELHLASQAGLIEQIETVYMMRVLERQCSEFISKMLPKAHLVTDNIANTDVAMDRVMDQKNAAAVGRESAAKKRNLKILSPKGGIQNPKNYTRFFVLSNSLEVSNFHNNTLIIARLPNKGGNEEEKFNRLLDNRQTAIIPERKALRGEKVWYIVQVEGRYPDDKWLQTSVDVLAKEKECDEVRILGSCHWVDPRVLTKCPQYVI